MHRAVEVLACWNYTQHVFYIFVPENPALAMKGLTVFRDGYFKTWLTWIALTCGDSSILRVYVQVMFREMSLSNLGTAVKEESCEI